MHPPSARRPSDPPARCLLVALALSPPNTVHEQPQHGDCRQSPAARHRHRQQPYMPGIAAQDISLLWQRYPPRPPPPPHPQAQTPNSRPFLPRLSRCLLPPSPLHPPLPLHRCSPHPPRVSCRLPYQQGMCRGGAARSGGAKDSVHMGVRARVRVRVRAASTWQQRRVCAYACGHLTMSRARGTKSTPKKPPPSHPLLQAHILHRSLFAQYCDTQYTPAVS
mmetsp:Transcript_25413/g.40967  ORF Transcript_25413/g.40967 Transcript_25413/m.40967 type:complete len:221 (-) Transcript_25413:2-664(-)